MGPIATLIVSEAGTRRRSLVLEEFSAIGLSWLNTENDRMRPHFVLLFVAGATLVSAQVRGIAAAKRGVSRQVVQACVASSVDEADAADAERVCRLLSQKKLSPDEAADLEAAALRRLERC